MLHKFILFMIRMIQVIIILNIFVKLMKILLELLSTFIYIKSIKKCIYFNEGLIFSKFFSGLSIFFIYNILSIIL
jgi:hypothetical protein